MNTKHKNTKRLAASLSVMFFFCGQLSASENLVYNGEASDGLAGWKGFQSTDSSDGNEYFVLAPKSTARTEDPIPLEPGVSYTLSGRFRGEGEEPTKLLVGLACFDADGTPINSAEVTIVRGTDTVLVQDAKAGDTSMFVEDASKWVLNEFIARNARVAFKTSGFGDFSDLPNRNLTAAGIGRISQADSGGWEVMLAEPLAEGFATGTQVRLHHNHYTYCYLGNPTGEPTTSSWQEFSFTFTLGEKEPGTTGTAPWAGTDHVQIVFMNDLTADTSTGATDIQIGNIVLSKQ